MEKSELIEIFKRARRLEFQTRVMRAKVAELESFAEKCTPAYGGAGVDAGCSDRLASSVVRLVNYRKQYTEQLDAYVHEQNRAKTLIQLVDDETGRIILEYRYLHGVSWNRLSDGLFYTRQHLMRLHAAGIMTILRKVNALNLSV